MSGRSKPKRSNFLVGVNEINTVQPGRIACWLAFNANDAIVVSVNPNLPVDQVFVLFFWQDRQHIRGTASQRLFSCHLKLVVIGSETRVVACSAAGGLR